MTSNELKLKIRGILVSKGKNMEWLGSMLGKRGSVYTKQGNIQRANRLVEEKHPDDLQKISEILEVPFSELQAVAVGGDHSVNVAGKGNTTIKGSGNQVGQGVDPNIREIREMAKEQNFTSKQTAAAITAYFNSRK